MLTQTNGSGLSARYSKCLAAFGVKLKPEYETAAQFHAKYIAYLKSKIDLLNAPTAEPMAPTPAPAAALAPKPKPRRRLTDADRGSSLWAAALHEAGHVAASFCYGPGCVFATIQSNGGGQMLPKSPLTAEQDRRITAAAWAVCSAFGHIGGGLRSDFRQLAARGVRAVRLGDEYDDSFLPYRESDSFKALRDEIRKDLAPKERAIIRMADELFRRCGEQVSGDELRRIWNAC